MTAPRKKAGRRSKVDELGIARESFVGGRDLKAMLFDMNSVRHKIKDGSGMIEVDTIGLLVFRLQVLAIKGDVRAIQYLHMLSTFHGTDPDRMPMLLPEVVTIEQWERVAAWEAMNDKRKAARLTATRTQESQAPKLTLKERLEAKRRSRMAEGNQS